MASENDISGLYTSAYSQVVGTALFIYDSIITIGDESKYFWTTGNQSIGPGALFYLNRSISMVYYLFIALFYPIGPQVDGESCTAMVKVFQVLQVLQYISPGAFTALRTFALSRSWALALLTFFLAVFPTVGLNLARFGLGLSGVAIPMVGCEGTDAASTEIAKSFTIISRTSLITADCLAVLVTWWKLSSRNMHDSPNELTPGAHGLKKKNTFKYVLLHDGTVYFVVIGVLNCLQLTFTLLSFQIEALQSASYISNLTEPLTAVLISRFLLHLQSVKYRTSGVGSSNISSVCFERAIGSLDASLSPEDFFDEPDSMEPGTIAEVSDQSHDGNGPSHGWESAADINEREIGEF